MSSWTNPMIGNHDGSGQKYGDPRDGGTRIHRGYDIGTAGVTGRPVVAGGSGLVTIASYATMRGNHVLIDHGDGHRTLYQHLASMSVGVGQTVTAGQQIGICGGTGGSYPIHLHLQVFARGAGTSLNDDADTIDPKPFFIARGVVLGETTPATPTPTTPTTPSEEDDMQLFIGLVTNNIASTDAEYGSTFTVDPIGGFTQTSRGLGPRSELDARRAVAGMLGWTVREQVVDKNALVLARAQFTR